MTTDKALAYVMREIEKIGYYDLSFEETYEIYDRINRMEDTSQENLDRMIEEVF